MKIEKIHTTPIPPTSLPQTTILDEVLIFSPPLPCAKSLLQPPATH